MLLKTLSFGGGLSIAWLNLQLLIMLAVISFSDFHTPRPLAGFKETKHEHLTMEYWLGKFWHTCTMEYSVAH